MRINDAGNLKEFTIALVLAKCLHWLCLKPNATESNKWIKNIQWINHFSM